MKLNFVTVIRNLIWALLLAPVFASADQNDERLNALFETLRSNSNAVVQSDTIVNIWKIWYESNRDEIDELMMAGEAAAQAGQYEKAEQIFTRVIESAPDFSEGWNRRATVRYYNLDYDGSLADIKETLALEPRHFGALWGKGMILGSQKKFAGAIEAFEDMLTITPFSLDAIQRIKLLREQLQKQAV